MELEFCLHKITKYMTETYIYDNYSEGFLNATIRKSLVREAARNLRSHGEQYIGCVLSSHHIMADFLKILGIF